MSKPPSDNNSGSSPVSKSVFASALSMASGTLFSRILGFARDVVIAAYFDRAATDAFVASFRVPNFFRRLFGEGSLSASFIPLYIEARHNNIESSKKLRSATYGFFLVVASVLTVSGIIFAEEMMHFLVSGDAYQNVEGQMTLTVRLSQVMLGYLFLVVNYAFLLSIAQSYRYFFIPAAAAAFFNLAFIILALLPKSWWDIPEMALAYGVLAGGVCQALVVVALLVRIRQFPRPELSFRKSGLGRVLRNMIPGMLSMGVLQIFSLVNLSFLSRLESGSISAVYYADRILEMPQSLIALSLGSALLPTLSQLWVEHKKSEMVQRLSGHINTLLFWCLPSAVGMYVLAQPIIEVLFMRGSFEEQDALRAASVVEIYSLLLISLSLIRIVNSGFYSMKKVWWPASFSLVVVLFHITLAPYWMEFYGLRGLVFSTTLSSYLNLILTLVSFHMLAGQMSYKNILKSGIGHLMGAILMGVVVHWYYSLIQGWSAHWPSAVHSGFALISSVFLGVVIYSILCKLFKSQEWAHLENLFRRRWMKT